MTTIQKLPDGGALTTSDALEVSRPSSATTITATTISAQASDNSFNDSGGGFVAAGFAVDDEVKVTGFTGDTANNIYSATITALTTGKMTIGGTDGDVIVDDAAGESVTISKWESRRANSSGGGGSAAATQLWSSSNVNGTLGTGNEVDVDVTGYVGFMLYGFGVTFGVADQAAVQLSTDGTTFLNTGYFIDTYGDGSGTASTFIALGTAPGSTTNTQRLKFEGLGIDTGVVVMEGSSTTLDRRGVISSKDAGAAVVKVRILAYNGNNATAGAMALYGF